MRAGRERAEHDGAEHDAGDHLADHRRLAEPAEQDRQHACGGEDHRELQQQVRNVAQRPSPAGS